MLYLALSKSQCLIDISDILEFISDVLIEESGHFVVGMWKLKIAEGGSPWLRTTNNHVGRQIWEFDPNLGTPEQIREVEEARENFWKNRFEQKHSSDLLMRMQVLVQFRSKIVIFFFFFMLLWCLFSFTIYQF